MPEALSKVELVGSCARLQNAAGLGRFVSAFAIPKHPGDPCDPWFCGTSIVFVIFVSFMVKSGSIPARSQKSFPRFVVSRFESVPIPVNPWLL